MYAPPSSSVLLWEEEPSPSLCKLSYSTANSGNQWSFKPHWLEFSSSHLPPMSICLLWQCWLRYAGRFPDTITWKFARLICWSSAFLHGSSRLRSVLRFRLMLPSGSPDFSFNIAARAASTDLNHGLPYKVFNFNNVVGTSHITPSLTKALTRASIYWSFEVLCMHW